MNNTENLECAFGNNQKNKALQLDRKWCQANCRGNDAYERHMRSYGCYWHFKELGLDLNKR